MKHYASAIVNEARKYVGCRQGDATHKALMDYYNANTSGYNMTYSDAWCAAFASTIAIKCGYTDIIPTTVNCGTYIRAFISMGRWVENDAYKPGPGDYIFYNWDDSGYGDCTTGADHVGIVESCDGTNIVVIEGNKGSPSMCGRRYIQVNGRYIRGYGVPAYDDRTTNITASTGSLIPEGTACNYSGKVIKCQDSPLNVRQGPSTGYPVISSLKQDAVVKIVAEYSGWGKLSTNGWVCLDYIAKDTGVKETAVSWIGYVIKCEDSSLNVRSGPSTNYAIKSTLRQGAKVTIVKESNGWGQVQNSGWVCLDFISKTAPVTNTSTSTSTTVAPYSVTVNDRVGVNVRTGPGTNYTIKAVASYGMKLSVTKVNDNWLKIASGTYAGCYIYASCTIANGTVSARSYAAKVNSSNGLNVRKGPSTGFSVVKALRNNTLITIAEEQNGWGKLSDNSGWVSLQYVKKI